MVIPTSIGIGGNQKEREVPVADKERTKIYPRDHGDEFGRRTTAGLQAYISDRKLRKLHSGRARFVHRTVNGVNDPLTWFHLVYALANIRGEVPFSAGGLTKHLNEAVSIFIWDSTSVGRILNDIYESFTDVDELANSPIRVRRDWQGTYYVISEQPAPRRLLINLLEDLHAASQKVMEIEARGERPSKLSSPASSLPTFVSPFVAE